jgi:hypothetical protein
MQDRIRQIDETSCTARPDHTFGSKREELRLSKCSPLHPQEQTLLAMIGWSELGQ